MTSATLAAGLEAPAELTLTCPECGDTVTGKPAGAGSASWRLGLHRRNKHNVQGAGKKKGRPKSGAPSEHDFAAHPITSTIRDIASEIGGTGTPTVDQLTAGLGRGAALLTFTGAALVVESDRGIDHDKKSTVIDYLSIGEDDAKALMHPIARILAPTKINAKYGRQVIENVDVIGAFGALVQCGMHWREYLDMRREGNRLLAQQLAQQQDTGQGAPFLTVVPDLADAPIVAAQQAGAVYTPPAAAGTIYTPPGTPGTVTEPGGMVHSAPPQQGVVVDAAMVQGWLAAKQRG